MKSIFMVMSKYGLVLTIDQVASVLNVTPETIHNKRSNGTMPIKMYGTRPLMATAAEVARYLDEMEAMAT